MKYLFLILIGFALGTLGFGLYHHNKRSSKAVLFAKHLKEIYGAIEHDKGKTDRFLHPGYSACGRCGLTWATVEGHDTNYDNWNGCFPLCEGCWSKLTPEERLPFYRQMVDEWIYQDELWDVHVKGRDYYEQKWQLIKEAVLDGK